MSYAAAEADRRIENTLQIGKVIAVDPDAAVASVQVGEITVPNVRVGQMRVGPLAFWWMPASGEQVLVAFPGGDMGRGVIVCSIYAGNAPSSDPDQPMIALGGGTMVLDGTLEVTGDVIAQGISLVTHIHPGVQTGGGVTGEPQ